MFELTGYTERELMGHPIEEALVAERGRIGAEPDHDSARVGRQAARPEARAEGGVRSAKCVTAELFPAYDEDGGVLVALTPV